jgi:hypothetical protein
MNHDDDQRLLTLINDGVSTSFNQYGAGHGLAPLAWKISGADDVTLEATHPDGRSHPDAGALCQDWASLLGFVELLDSADEGFRSWYAAAGGWQVEIHCVTDSVKYAERYPDDPI